MNSGWQGNKGFGCRIKQGPDHNGENQAGDMDASFQVLDEAAARPGPQ
jgi:hypothetical protein